MTGCVLAGALALVCGAAAQIYVSPSGNDKNGGTENAPVRTLERARDIVRTRNQRMSADITVHLRPGVYRLQRPLTLDARNSGTGEHNVIYESTAAGEYAIFSGGMRVSGWQLADRTRNRVLPQMETA